MEIEQTAEGIFIKGDIEHANIEQLTKALQTAIQGEANEIQLDLSEVAEIETSGLQVLISALKSADVAQKSLHIVAFSAPVEETFKLSGLAPLFLGEKQ